MAVHDMGQTHEYYLFGTAGTEMFVNIEWIYADCELVFVGESVFSALDTS